MRTLKPDYLGLNSVSSVMCRDNTWSPNRLCLIFTIFTMKIVVTASGATLRIK